MSSINVDALLSGQSDYLRTKEVSVEGIDSRFLIHEFPAELLWSLDENRPKDEQEARHYYAAIVVRLLKGHKHEPSEAEVRNLLKGLGYDAVFELYKKGIRFSDEVGQGTEEAAAKN